MKQLLLKEYIQLLIESKLPPSSNGTTTGRSGFSKNQQTPGFAGGDGRVLSKDQTAQSPDDNLFYHYMKVDGPDQDPETGLTFAICKVEPKFYSIIPQNLRKYKISATGADAEQEVQTKINQFFLKIKSIIDQDINNVEKSSEQNIYNSYKKENTSW
jgi:hypothetical protein